MANELQLRVNEKVHTITASPETPLLYVLTDDLALQGPRFGCGLGQCGCCSVLADGVEVAGANLEHGLLHIDLRRQAPETVIQTIRIGRN